MRGPTVLAEVTAICTPPWPGPKAPIVRSILRNSAAHPEIPQRNIQVLIWAIIARTEFDEMPDDVQQTARALLTEDQIDELPTTTMKDITMKNITSCAGCGIVAFEAGARMYECWRAHGLDYQGPPTILDS